MPIEIIHGWRDLKPEQKGAAVALGAFDGVHAGHRRVIDDAREAARRLGVPAGVVTFDPHPRRFFVPGAQPFRIMSPRQQARALAAAGVERLHLLPFGSEMASMAPEAFVRDVLVEGLGVRHVAVGFDVTFGKDRSGDPEQLKALGALHGFSVSVAERLADDAGDKISSTALRRALGEGRLEEAAALLGRPFAIEGEVVHGDKRGRTIGFPTANVRLPDYVRPRFGVYATRTRLPDGRVLDGVANLGVRPMWESPEPLLEVWLFDFDEDLYGQVIETELVAFLRPEARFDGLEPLIAQIERDVVEAKAALAR
ncbi:MAG TPA: bifunctional riboflavin kinase/FAD synthetase [Caulobacteraceae bacterium]